MFVRKFINNLSKILIIKVKDEKIETLTNL